MKSLELNRWYAGEDEICISLLRYYVDITICKNDEFIFYRLRVIDEDRKELIFNFYSLEDAVRFTEDTINKCITSEEIINSYDKQFKNNKFKSIKKVKR